MKFSLLVSFSGLVKKSIAVKRGHQSLQSKKTLKNIQEIFSKIKNYKKIKK